MAWLGSIVRTSIPDIEFLSRRGQKIRIFLYLIEKGSEEKGGGRKLVRGSRAKRADPRTIKGELL